MKERMEKIKKKGYGDKKKVETFARIRAGQEEAMGTINIANLIDSIVGEMEGGKE